MKGCYVHTQDLLQLDSHYLNIPVCWCTKGPSPLCLDRLQWFLSCYPDTQFSSYLVHVRGLSSGFHLGFSRASMLQAVYCNHPSSTQHPQTIMEHSSSKEEAGRIVGPLPPSTVSRIQISPLGLAPRSHSDKWRMIVDQSSPCGRSVNDGIHSKLCSLHYM